MNGIQAAFVGRLGKDAEVRTTRDGKPWASFPVAVDTDRDNEAGTAWVRVACFGDSVADLAPRLTKGTEIYTEGRLTLRPWVDADGRQRSGLSLATGLVQVMGQIGRRAKS
jgi:single-strand DNA-binding protein